MGKKVYRFNARFYVIITLICLAILYFNFKNEVNSYFAKSIEILKSVESKKTDISKINSDRYFIFTEDAGYAVYTGRFVLKLKGNFYFNKDKNFETLLKEHSYTEILNFFNFSVPEKIGEYYFPERVPSDIEREAIAIPTSYSEGVKYVDSAKLNMVFVTLFYGVSEKAVKEEKSEMTTVDIINATSNEEYIKNFQEKFSAKEFSCSYSNYGESKSGSYIYNNGTAEGKMEEFIMAIDERYIKTSEEIPVNFQSEIIYIAGDSDGAEFTIAVIGEKKKVKKFEKKLKELKYENIKKSIEKAEKTVIIYNKEDYFTAYKLSELTGIKEMEEDNTLENEIKIYLDGKADK